MTIRTNGLGHGLFIEPLTAANGNEQPLQLTIATATPWLLSMSTTSIEPRGTSARATRGGSDLGKGGPEGFDAGESSKLI